MKEAQHLNLMNITLNMTYEALEKPKIPHILEGVHNLTDLERMVIKKFDKAYETSNAQLWEILMSMFPRTAIKYHELKQKQKEKMAAPPKVESGEKQEKANWKGDWHLWN